MNRISQKYCAYRPLPVFRILLLNAFYHLSPFLFALVSAFWFPLCANAQSSTATLSGTVEDQSRAVIAGASLALLSVDQGALRLATTNSEGNFVFPLLSPGRYSLTVTHEGFAPIEFRDIVLNVNDQVALTIQLQVGSLKGQTITVIDVGSLIDKSPGVATTVDRQFVAKLPLNGRSLVPLILLAPGVVPTRASSTNAGQFSVNGQRANANYFTVDGASANIGVGLFDVVGQQSAGAFPGLTATGGTNNLVSIDALEEFKINTSSYAPEFGRTPGGQISLVTRSGSTQYHGTAFEYFRNDALDANDWFSNANRLRKAALRQNQFGGTLSGPLIFLRFGESPRWFAKAKRTFFFFSYEGLRLRQPQTAVTTVASLRLRQQAPVAVQPILAGFPLPTGPEIGTTGQSPLAATYSNPSQMDATSIRIDHVHSSNLNIFGRFNYSPSSTIVRSQGNPAWITTTHLNTTTATVAATSSLSPTLINDLRFNYSRTSSLNSHATDAFGGATPLPPSYLIPPSLGPQTFLILLVFSGQFQIGTLTNNLQRQLNLVDTMSLVRGNHSLKFGVDYRRMTPIYAPRDYTQFIFFLDQASILSNRASIAGANIKSRTKPVFNNFSAFGQDTWTVNRKFTLTYGLRWDVNPPPSEADRKLPFVVAGFDNRATVSLAPAGTPLWKTTYNNVAPRIGLAYQLADNPGSELILRGGFGLFYDLGNGQGSEAYGGPPFTANTPNFAGVPIPLTTTQATPPAFPTDARASQIIGYDPNLKLPYTLQWNLNLERALGTNQTFSAAYIAALGRRQIRGRVFIRPSPNIMTLNFIDNGSTSSYHSMQLQFNRRLSRRLQALASYTWSHAIDEVSDELNANIQLRGNADFDVRHNFSAAVTYELPGGGRSSLSQTLLHGWSLNSTIHALSPTPVSPFSRFTTIDARQFRAFPNLVAGQDLYIYDSQSPGGKRLNRAAFVAPPVGTSGNLGRNVLRGFPIFQVDMALHRRFKFSERAYAEFWTEAFNVLNHPNFGNPIVDIANPNFGRPTQVLGRDLGGQSAIYQIGGPRSIQFAIRLGF
jgi:hypothetical protein